MSFLMNMEKLVFLFKYTLFFFPTLTLWSRLAKVFPIWWRISWMSLGPGFARSHAEGTEMLIH